MSLQAGVQRGQGSVLRLRSKPVLERRSEMRPHSGLPQIGNGGLGVRDGCHCHRGPSWLDRGCTLGAGAADLGGQVLLAAAGLGVLGLPSRERLWPSLPHVDVTGFLPLSPSLSLPICLAVSICPAPRYILPSPSYFCRCGSWGPPILPSLPHLVPPAFSLSAPGGRYTAGLAPTAGLGRGQPCLDPQGGGLG